MPAAVREYDLLLEQPHPFAPMKILSALIAACLLGFAVNASAAEPAKAGKQTSPAPRQEKIPERTQRLVVTGQDSPDHGGNL